MAELTKAQMKERPRDIMEKPVLHRPPPTAASSSSSSSIASSSAAASTQPPPVTTTAKTDGKSAALKRKLFGGSSASTSPEDEDRKGGTPKRRKSQPASEDESTPPGSTPRSSGQSIPRHGVPLSERQQMQIFMQMTASEQTGDCSPRSGSPTGVQGSATKKTPLDKKVNKRNDRGETQLHQAAKKGDVKYSKRLIKAGADVNVTDYAGWTPLHEACNHGSVEVARHLLKAGANVNVQGLDNDTPLHDASGNGHQKVVELLMRHGANPHQTNAKGKTPLDIAATEHIGKILRQEVALSSSSACSSSADEGNLPTSPESAATCSDKEEEEGNKGLKDSSDKEHSRTSAATPSSHTPIYSNSTSSPQAATDDPYALPSSPQGSFQAPAHPPTSAPSIFKKVHVSHHMNKSSSPRLTIKFTHNKSRENRAPATVAPRAQKPVPGSDRYKTYSVCLASDDYDLLSSPAGSTSSQESDLYDPQLEITTFGSKRTLKQPASGLSEPATDMPTLSQEPDCEQRRGLKRPCPPEAETPTSQAQLPSSSQPLSPNIPLQEPHKTNVVSSSVSSQPSPKPSPSPSPLTVKTESLSSPKLEKVSPGSKSPSIANKVSPTRPQTPKQENIEVKTEVMTEENPKTEVDRLSPNVDPKGSPKSQLTSKTKIDSNRASPQSDQGSPKEDSSRPCSPKVPPLKIIIPTKTTAAPTQQDIEKQRTSTMSKSLPYVINPTQAEGAEVTTVTQSESRPQPSCSVQPSSEGPVTSEEASAPPVDISVAEDKDSNEAGTRKTRRTLAAHQDKEDDDNTKDSSTSSTSSSKRDEKTGADKKDDETQGKQSERRMTRSAARSQQQQKDTEKDEEKPHSNGRRGNHRNENHEEEVVHTHNKRKLRQRHQQQQQQQQQQERQRQEAQNREATENSEGMIPVPHLHSAEKPENPYELFLDIRKKVSQRHQQWLVVQPKAPQGFKDYLMVSCNYVLKGNVASRLSVPMLTAPTSLEGPMKELFNEQEKSRYKLRLQHVIEREKLMLSNEQEILRVHGRGARALANQSTPLSVCSILRDEDIYNSIDPEQEEKERGVRSRYNGRQFLSWLQDVDDKFEKIKESLLMRHHHEAESLHAVQKLEWEWKMKEHKLVDHRTTPLIDHFHVPMVQVNDDFDLLPA